MHRHSASIQAGRARPAETEAPRRTASPSDARRPAFAQQALLLRQAALLGLVADFHDASSVAAGLIALADSLRHRFGVERVAIGLLDRPTRGRLGGGGDRRARDWPTTVAAISGQAAIDPRAVETRLLAAAMDEACRRGLQLRHGSAPSDAGRAPRAARATSGEPLEAGPAHRALLAGRPHRAATTTPLCHRGRVVGALLVEHAAARPLGALRLELLRQLAVMLAPMIAARRAAERGLGRHLRDAADETLERLRAPRRLGLKLASALLAAVLAALALVPVEHDVVAAAELVPLELRTITAPVSGFVGRVAVEPGDAVREGQLLFELDTRTLVLERERHRGELERLAAELRAARAAGDRRRVAVLKAQRERAAAELALAERRIERSRVTAPRDGRVLSGELARLVGAPVERGQRLLELAPDGAHTVSLLVDERDIGLVAAGQRGALALEARPGARLALSVTDIRPVAVAGDGRNRFRVDATLADAPAELLPGQSGIARLRVGETSALGNLTRRFVEWLGMRRWEWLG